MKERQIETETETEVRRRLRLRLRLLMKMEKKLAEAPIEKTKIVFVNICKKNTFVILFCVWCHRKIRQTRFSHANTEHWMHGRQFSAAVHVGSADRAAAPRARGASHAD